MRKLFAGIVFVLGFSFLVPLSLADSTESVRVIKFDKKNYDMVVERNNGERLLVQHNRLCQTADIDFPVKLVWTNDGRLKKVKVAFNEICDVFSYSPYDGTIKIAKRIKSYNLLEADHKAEIEWGGKKYRINYGDGCKWLRLFVDKQAYISTPNGNLKNAVIYLPNHRGQCNIESSDFLEDMPDPADEMPSIEKLDYQAQSNQVYFYWEPVKEADRPLYLISYSKRNIDPADFRWDQMPNLKFTRNNSYTATELANGNDYYFYLGVIDANRKVSKWKQVVVRPKSTDVFVNNPWEEPFEIEIAEETKDYFRLRWPDVDNARKYMVWLYANGKPQFLKYMTNNEILIEKKAKYIGKGLRLAVRALPIKPRGRHLYDGHFWRFDPN